MAQFVLFINCPPFQLFIPKHIPSRRLRWIMRGRSAGKKPRRRRCKGSQWDFFFFFFLPRGPFVPDALYHNSDVFVLCAKPGQNPRTEPSRWGLPSSPSTPPCFWGWQTLQHVEWWAAAQEEALRFATFHLVVSFAEGSIIQSASQAVELLSLFGPWVDCKPYRVICPSTATHL